MLKVAVVILNWNGADFLKKFLPGVLQYSRLPGVRVYVADNSSTDHSLEVLSHNEFNEVEVILLKENYGFSEGYNQALVKIEAEYFMLLNSDVGVTENWLTPLISLLDSDPLIAACSPKIKSFDQPDFFEYAGAAGGYIDKYGYPFCRGRIFNAIETDYGQYDNKKEVFWTTGACMLIRANLYKLAGGLDADYFAHFEEIDLCWRLKNRGYKLFSVPESTVYHVGGGTLPQENPFKTYLNFRNSLYTLYKNLPPEKVRTTIITRLLLDGISVVRYIPGFKMKHIISILRAHVSFYKNIGKYRKFRLSEKKYIKNYQHDQVYPRSIVKDYYLGRKYTLRALEWLYYHDTKH